jgi:hypothetical protein
MSRLCSMYAWICFTPAQSLMENHVTSMHAAHHWCSTYVLPKYALCATVLISHSTCSACSCSLLCVLQGGMTSDAQKVTEGANP